MGRAALVLLFLFLHSVHASQVEFFGQPTHITVSGIDIPVYPQAMVEQLDGSKVLVKLSGSGIRKTTVVFVQVNVYYAASYVMYPEKLNLTNPMEGIEASPTRFLHMTTLRPLTGEEIRLSMEQALQFNGVDLDHPSMVKLMTELDGLSVDADEKFVFGATPGVSEDRIFFELPNKSFEEEANNIGLDFWKIWFGKPFDSGLKELQVKLVGK